MESEGKAEFAAPRAALAHMAKVALAQMVTQQKIKAGHVTHDQFKKGLQPIVDMRRGISQFDHEYMCNLVVRKSAASSRNMLGLAPVLHHGRWSRNFEIFASLGRQWWTYVMEWLIQLGTFLETCARAATSIA
eukprot:5141162-Pyramimonas_sp.AAC.3